MDHDPIFNRQRLLMPLQSVVVFVIATLFVYIVQHQAGGLLGVDGYYHLRMAALYADGTIQGAGENFHWMQHSILNGAFSDKDYLWHILLSPFAMIAGNDLGTLQHAGMWATAMASGLMALIAFRIFSSHGLFAPLLWVLLLLASSETFIYRIGMCRSHVLSISFALLGWHLITRQARLGLVIIAALYTLSYTAPHLLIVLASIWWLIHVIAPGNKDGSPLAGPRRFIAPLAPIGWVILGISIGAVLHPESLNLLKLWLVQNLVVPLQSYNAHALAQIVSDIAGTTSETVEVTNIGMEMSQTQGRELLSSHLIGVVLLVLPWIVASSLRIRATRRDVFAYLCAFLFFAMMLASERFAEYFFPFVVLAGGGLLSRCLAPNKQANDQQTPKAPSRSHRIGYVAFAILVVTNLIVRPAVLIDTIADRPHHKALGLGQAIAQHVPKGQAIYHPDWHLFSMLFFAAPKHDYVVGLDPTFLALKSPTLYQHYVNMRSGAELDDVDNRSYDQVIRETFGMRYVAVVSDSHPGFARMMARATTLKRAKILVEDAGDGWVLYELTDRP